MLTISSQLTGLVEKLSSYERRDLVHNRLFYIKALLHYDLFTRGLDFSCVLTYVFDTNMLVSKTRQKTPKEREKITRKLTNTRKLQENVSILHYAGKNASLLRFSRVLRAFFAHRPY